MKSTVTRIDMTAQCGALDTEILFERDCDRRAVRVYHPTVASWRRLATVVNKRRIAGEWEVRANTMLPGMVAERVQ